MRYRPRSLPESELFQLFIKDPDGLTIELNFFGVDEDAGLGRRGLLQDAAGAGSKHPEEESREGQGRGLMNAPQAARKSGAPSFAGVSYDEALARARELVPALRERAARAEAARIMPAETLADLHASGVLRTLQPKRWGGMEFDYVAYVDFPLELARGCASTGWNVANLLIHHWMLALYDERAQEEVWGENPEALIASGIAFPQGSGRKADGGFVVSGRGISPAASTSPTGTCSR